MLLAILQYLCTFIIIILYIGKTEYFENLSCEFIAQEVVLILFYALLNFIVSLF